VSVSAVASSFAQAGRCAGLRVGGLPDGEHPTLCGAFTRDTKDPDANGRPHWSTAAGGHLYYSVTGEWILNAYGFFPDEDGANAFFATAGAVPAGEVAWRYAVDGKWGDRTLTVAEL
jgi:hypothetical protein